MFYTVSDLKNVLNTCPCSSKKGYIAYGKNRLIEIIRQDFNGKRAFLKRQYWNDEAPAIYGLNSVTPYSEEAEAFAKSQKTHGGGRGLIVMNEAYFSNARYSIENKYWDLQEDSSKRDTRKSIRDAVSLPVMTGNETELRRAVEQLLNAFLSKVNKEIASKNDFLKSKGAQFFYYMSFYKASYVQQQIGNPTELLHMLDIQRNIMEAGFRPLSANYKKDKRFIIDIVSLLSEKYLTDEEKVTTIVERIYSRETPLIQQLRNIYDEFLEIKIKTYQLEEEIKTETEKRISASERIYPNSLIIQHAQNNGLISISFRLPDK